MIIKNFLEGDVHFNAYGSKLLEVDFYKQFLGKPQAATKIQAANRGKQTRKKINDTKKGGRRMKYRNATKRNKYRTTRNKFIFEK